ncbi:PREDICTED: uncharacterized protein LOC108775736 [Cyphomyrmex costatus]|uniref:uncharacterized protein LOC108775736 n=1 Tax=Cyphomyrmex costatus TaxID=456900 RepID=UPI0008521E68|nr:PREDICTED: uncharacterized protein LOC108775736 [Cyphomyrmex costatus]
MSLEMIRNCNGNEDAMDAFLSSSSSITSLVKLLLHRVYWKQKFILVESVIHDWTYVKNSHFRDIMLKYARLGSLGSSTYFYIASAAVTFAFSVMLGNIYLALFSEKQTFNGTYEKKLMLAAYCTFGHYYTFSFAYCAIEALQFVQILVNVISQCGGDGFFFDLTMHMCGQFAILRMNFNALSCDKFSYRNELDVLLKRHYRLVRLSYYMEKAFTLAILAQVLMSVLVLCVEGFLLILSLKINDAFTAMKHSVYIIALLIQLFLYCLAGQTLEFQSKELAYGIYESPWYSFDVNMMKNLPLIILRATNPQQLTAGKFVPINFMTFKEILKASASYLSVLRCLRMKSYTDWNTDTTNILKFYKNLLGIIGLWVLNEKNIFSRIRWFLSTIVETSTSIIMSLEMIRHCNGHEDAMDAFLLSSSSIISLVKLLLHRVYWRQKSVLVESVIHDWTYVKNSHFRDIMLKYARIGRLGSSIFFCMGCASVVSFVSSVVIANINLPWTSEKQVYNETYERKLMLAAYCTFGKYYTSFFAYCAIEVLQFVQILVNGISQCGNDGFFFDLTMHMCGQFAILRMDFNALGCDKFSCYSKLDILLKRHYRLVYLSRYLEKAFTLVILAQILMSVVVLCVEGFLLLLSLEMNDALTAAKHGVFIISLLVQLFLYCFAGQTLEFQSKELAYAIYESPWYSFDVNMMKNLPLIILRATNPQQLTAGKFVAINFMTFKEILKASASYLSVLRVMIKTLFLKLYGLWPLQKQTVFTKIQWGFCLIAQFMILPCLTTEFLWSNNDASSNIESITFFASTTTGIIKNLCFIISQKRLRTNINAAIDDWLSIKNNMETRKIMKKYAVKAKTLTFTLLYSLYVCLGMYIAVIIFINLKQIFFTDELNLANVNTTDWMLLIPSGPLNHFITGPQYAVILTIQIVQSSVLSFLLFTVDSFFFNIILHLTGQLEVLKNNFKTFTSEPKTVTNYRKKFVNLVNRHSLLMELYQNLEDTFHFLILYQIVVVTVLLALVGLRLNICINEKNHVEAIKSVFVLNYLVMQSLVYTYGGEFLQRKSENIFYTLYTTSWFTLPSALMKDLHFAMMRSSIPFRLTGGKFFYVNRETMMYVLKTAASYISVLRIALRKSFQLILTLSMHSIYTAMKHLLFVVVLLIQLFLYCFAGQTLEFQSQGLASAIYDLPWYNFDLNVMKNLPLMILRSTNPHQLTAGKFLAINFISFKEILKASASYLSVLRVMLET